MYAWGRGGPAGILGRRSNGVVRGAADVDQGRFGSGVCSALSNFRTS